MAELSNIHDLITFSDATVMLSVTADELWGIVREGLLTPMEGQDDDCFRWAELEALRKLSYQRRPSVKRRVTARP